MPRTTAPRTAAPPSALPFDVRLMNGVASGIFALAGVALLAGGVLWLTRAPLFTIRSIQLDGDLARNNTNTVRANALPALKGNFFSIDLQRARAAFEQVPWVRRALVRRIWPNRLAVRLEEHHAAAIWQAEDGSEHLVNDHGEVFEANVGDVEDDGLPVFNGPDDSAAAMLAIYERIVPVFRGMDAGIETLRLSRRGSWRVQLDSGASVELGRGNDDEVQARCERFVRTLKQVTARFPQQPLEYADLRHADGYAVRLAGVTTKTTH